MKRNSKMVSLKAGYLFPEINQRKKTYLADHPLANLISMGIGDTTQPLPPFITAALVNAAEGLGTQSGYSGYGPEQGNLNLRERIANVFYADTIDAEDLFVSDGAKCDLGRLQMLFGGEVSIAVQDPSYPVYIEGSIINGVKEIVRMPCLPENEFFPDLSNAPPTDLIYFCSPNNPTGTAATREQLTSLVAFAKKNRSIIIFDSAYAHYIQDPILPRSIYEIEGAKEVAIEVGSFSKLAGFTGIRLGWVVVPKELKYEDGSSVRADWNRLISTVFNGASNIAQAGGSAVLEKEGMEEVEGLISFYLENARMIKEALEERGEEVFGGEDAPYLWVRIKGKSSWEAFQHFLEENHIVTTPGSGFGEGGEGFVRFSAFNRREQILEAIDRLKVLV